MKHFPLWRTMSLAVSMPLCRTIVVALLLMECLLGCSALMTTHPLVQQGGDYVKDGAYSLVLEEFREQIPLTVAYDLSTASYMIDAGLKYGTFQATCCREKAGQLLLSVTLSSVAQKKAFDSVTELEGGFLSVLHLNARLIENGDAYDIWLLKSSRHILDGCHLTSMPPKKLLQMLPSTNAPPFVYVGKLLRQ